MKRIFFLTLIMLPALAVAQTPLYLPGNAAGIGATVSGNSKVGIGTNNPRSPLEVFVAGDNNTVQTGLIIQQTNPGSPNNKAGVSLDFGIGNNGSNQNIVGRISLKETYWSTQPKMVFSLWDAGNAMQDRMVIDTYGNVGIGTMTPSGKLDVYTPLPGVGIFPSQYWSTENSSYNLRLQTTWNDHGITQQFIQRFNGYDHMMLSFLDGKIGIGAAIPSAKLDVYTPLPGQGVFASQYWSTQNPDYNLRLQTTWDNNGIGQQFIQRFNSFDHTVLSFLGGQVGIGTTTPDSKLTVKGHIHTQEVRVDLTGSVAPDYVFEPDYNLLSLSELETYVTQNKHLPEVPSAKEMEKEGLNLKEMNLLLLRKIEELTLHLIEQNKTIADLKEKTSSPDPSGKKVEELTLHLIEQNRKIENQQKEIEKLKSH